MIKVSILAASGLMTSEPSFGFLFFISFTPLCRLQPPFLLYVVFNLPSFITLPSSSSTSLPHPPRLPYPITSTSFVFHLPSSTVSSSASSTLTSASLPPKLLPQPLFTHTFPLYTFPSSCFQSFFNSSSLSFSSSVWTSTFFPIYYTLILQFPSYNLCSLYASSYPSRLLF